MSNVLEFWCWEQAICCASMPLQRLDADAVLASCNLVAQSVLPDLA